jgi:hypothetical protein
VSAENDTTITKNNTAFYEGVSFNYIIPSPEGFEMNTDDASDDGYSFAFIQNDSSYKSAPILIGFNFFSIKDELRDKFDLEMLINEDTSALRKHYGPTLTIDEIIPAVTGTDDSLRSFFINDTTTFIPNVMTSYFDSGNEILIIELSILYSFPRFKAEEIYIEFIRGIRILPKGKLETG